VKRSTDHILTTHAGRLDGPPEYRQMSMALMAGGPWDPDSIRSVARTAMLDVIGHQTDAGIDVISDGEIGKIGFGGRGLLRASPQRPFNPETQGRRAAVHGLRNR
jgi:5-methyltetrahydropteroyltriglutamate--homocysteine methyltransferase